MHVIANPHTEDDLRRKANNFGCDKICGTNTSTIKKKSIARNGRDPVRIKW